MSDVMFDNLYACGELLVNSIHSLNLCVMIDPSYLNQSFNEMQAALFEFDTKIEEKRKKSRILNFNHSPDMWNEYFEGIQHFVNQYNAPNSDAAAIIQQLCRYTTAHSGQTVDKIRYVAGYTAGIAFYESNIGK